MNAVVESAIRNEDERREQIRKKQLEVIEGRAREKFTPERIAEIIQWLNAKEADQIKLKFYRDHIKQEKAIAHCREIPTKPAPFRPFHANPFR